MIRVVVIRVMVIAAAGNILRFSSAEVEDAATRIKGVATGINQLGQRLGEPRLLRFARAVVAFGGVEVGEE